MRQFLPMAFVLAPALAAAGCLHAPMPWSPDGQWFAYTVQVRPIDQLPSPGWIYRTGADEPAWSPEFGKGANEAYRIWATRGDTGASVLLEESSQPLSAPGWSPDGRALSFGKVVSEADGPGRFDVVILEGMGRRRVVASRPLPEVRSGLDRLPGQAIAWSPDGRYLAIPQFRPQGVAIIRADNGRQVNAINDAFLPSWSPDGARLAFFIRGTSDSLQCIDSILGQPRLLAEIGQAGQAPAWSRDGSTLLVVARRPVPRAAEPPGEQAELLRVRVDPGQAETLQVLTSEATMGHDRSVEGVSIAFDREGENVFCATVVEGQPNQIAWYRPRDNLNVVFKKFWIVDHSAPMGSLSLAPDGKTLAARSGPVGRLSYPALCDLESEGLKSRLIAPDDGARVEWIVTLVGSARSILADLPAPTFVPSAVPSPRVERPTLLPILGEFEPNSEAISRLRRIGKLGRPLCDRPSGSPAPGPDLALLLDEARLFFDYLGEDYPAALVSLEALEARTESPDRRLRLLSVRAQILLAQGHLDRASRTIAYLRAAERKPGRRLEWTGAGYSSIPEPPADRGWPDYLATRADLIRSMLNDEGPAHHPNPDAPRPGFGLDAKPKPRMMLPDRLLFMDEIPGIPPAPGRLTPRPRAIEPPVPRL